MATFKLRNGSHHTLCVKVLSGVPYGLPYKETLKDGASWTLKADEECVVVEVKMKYGEVKSQASAAGAAVLFGANIAANLHGVPITDGYEKGGELLEVARGNRKAGVYQRFTLITGLKNWAGEVLNERSFALFLDEGTFNIFDETTVIRH